MPVFEIRLLALPLGLILLPAALHAETVPDPSAVSPDDANAPSDIVVTALRTPVPIDKVSSSVTVLDRQAIEQAQPVALTDVLERTPGITINRNGGYGEVTGLSIRGAGTDQTVVVIDGMRVSDPTAPAGNFDFSQLFADDIARVEILRGAQSILWGSDAIGGVINVVTVTPTKPLEEDFSVEAGSHRTVDAHAGIGGTSSLVDWRISGSAFTTDGIPTLAGSTVANGYTRKAASATATLHLARNVSLDLRGYWDEGRNSYSDTFSLYPSTAIYPNDYATTKQWTAYAGLNVALLDGRWKNRLAVLQNQTDSENYTPIDSPALQFVGHGRVRRYEYQGSIDLARQVQIVFGAERKEERMETGSPFDAVMPFDLAPHRADTNSVYAQARVEPAKGLTLNGGVRYDHHSVYGGHTVFSAGGDYTPDGGTTLIRANYDQGFKAPSLYQLYSDYGNTTLKPETAKGWEVGLERHFGKVLSASATWFERSSKNLIDFAYCPYPLPATGAQAACYINFYGYYANVDRAKAKGLELAATARFGRLYADGNYSFVSSEDRTAGSFTYGQQLPRVPRHLANAELGYDWPGGVNTSVAVRTASSETNDDFSSLTLGAYAVVDLRAEWKLLPGLTLFGRVENVGDKYYQTAYGYNSLRRTGYVGIRTHF